MICTADLYVINSPYTHLSVKFFALSPQLRRDARG